MKKRYLYIVLLPLLAISFAFIMTKKLNKDAGKESVYELLPRKSSLVYSGEWEMVKNNAAVLLGKIKKNPADVKSLMALAAIYLQEARITGNYSYYNAAASKLVEDVLVKDSKNFEALTFKTTILLSQHQFERAKNIAEEVRQKYPHNAYVHGLLVDANVELGDYKAALDAADKMVSIRPDIRSYSRIAFLREIHGDLPGAIEAMKLAVDAGSPGDENTEWCRVQLGKLYEHIGMFTEAKMFYTIAANNRPNYPYALAGLARNAVVENDHAKALQYYQQADSILPGHIFKEGLIEVYNLVGQTEGSKHIAEDLLDELKRSTTNGQNEDHELAHAYMGVGNYEKALEYALVELQRRPGNIEVNETVAIVYYQQKEYAKALPFIETALTTNCKNPELLCYAGLIYAKTGNTEKAKMFLQEALKNNPGIPAELKNESKEVWSSLR